jgi:serine/threonine-protein kinase HipA
MKNRNFVAKNMNTFNRPTTHKDKKYLEKFGIQTCDLTKKEIENAIAECENAVIIIKNEILIRLEIEQIQDKKEILEKLVVIFNSYSE